MHARQQPQTDCDLKNCKNRDRPREIDVDDAFEELRRWPGIAEFHPPRIHDKCPDREPGKPSNAPRCLANQFGGSHGGSPSRFNIPEGGGGPCQSLCEISRITAAGRRGCRGATRASGRGLRGARGRASRRVRGRRRAAWGRRGVGGRGRSWAPRGRGRASCRRV